MKRREFLTTSLITLSSGLFLIRCGGGSSSSSSSPETDSPSDPSDPTNPTCSSGGQITYTNPGHSHTTIDLTQTEVADAVPGTYTLMGGGHTHTFNLSSTDFSNLENGQTISKTDNEGHGHIIDIKCS